MRALPLALLTSTLFLVLGRPFIDRGGVWSDEAVHGQLAVDLLKGEKSESLHMRWGMKDSYQGALKSYILCIPFRLFRINVRVLRWTTLALGTAAVFAGTLLAASLYGSPAGLYLGLLMAMDPAMIGASLYDQAPAVTGLALKMIGLLLLARWQERGKAGWAFGGGLCLGLGVWDKAHFLWFLCALPLAALLFHRGMLREKRTVRGLTAVAAGVLLGAAPFILFNVVNPLITFRDPGNMGWGLGAHLQRLPDWLALRWSYLLSGLTGQGIYSMASGQLAPDTLVEADLLLLYLGAPLLATAALARRWEALRSAAFWLGLVALIYLAAAFSPLPVKYHHFYTCYPFPQLAFAAMLATALRDFEGKPARQLGLAVLLGLPFLHHLRTLRSFADEMDRTGGSRQFYKGTNELFSWVDGEFKRRPGLTVYDDANIRATQRVILPDGPRRESPGREKSLSVSCAKGRVDHEVLILQRSPAELGWSADQSAGSPLVFREKPAVQFFYSDGSSWARVYRRYICAGSAMSGSAS